MVHFSSFKLDNNNHLQTVRSFVLRNGRLTTAQKSALTELWPIYGIDLHDQPLDITSLFNQSGNIIVEIGFGNGEALLECALKHPEKNFIGIEVYRAGVGHLLNAIKQHDLNNVRVINDDAYKVFKQYIPANSINAIHLFFPDPWPKKRHHKRRIVQNEFVELLLLALKSNGIFYIATDWTNYAGHVEAVLSHYPLLNKIETITNKIENLIERPNTKYEARGKRLNHTIIDLVYQKNIPDYAE